ncbi:glycoside hydrolase family 16 protein [Luteococcus japonicus]|nr:glycoside hydrolase family 16 protein [Luteococcus japonicus]
MFAASDTYASKAQPTRTNDGNRVMLATATGASNASSDTLAYMDFDTTGIAPDARVESVSLRVYVQRNDRAGVGSPVVWSAPNGWDPTKLTWGNKPAYDPTVLNPAVQARAGSWVTIRLSPTRSINRGGHTALTMGYNAEGSRFTVDSIEAGNAPQLIVQVAGSSDMARTQTVQALSAPAPTSAPAPQPAAGSEPTNAPAPAPAPAQPAAASAPAPATQGGFGTLTFQDEFQDLSSIDLTGNGDTSKKWFTDRPFGFPKMPASDLSVSDGVLNLNQSFDNLNFGISTYSKKAKAGKSFKYGYYEARIAFDQTNDAAVSQVRGFPSFWGISRDHLLGTELSRYGEFDVMEAWHPPYARYDKPIIAGTIHDWFGGSDHMTVGNNVHYANDANMTEFHTYGALWTPGRVTWYMDGKQILTQKYSANAAPEPNYLGHPVGTYSVLDNEVGQVMILGSAPGIPMKVDYVRIWQ